MKNQAVLYDPDQYAAYPGERHEFLDAYVGLLRGESPSEAVERLLAQAPTASQLLAATAATLNFESNSNILSALKSFLQVAVKKGPPRDIPECVLLEALKFYPETEWAVELAQRSGSVVGSTTCRSAIRALVFWGRIDLAERLFAEADGGQMNTEYLLLQGLLHAKRGRYEKCLEVIDGLYPDEPEATMMALVCYAHMDGISADTLLPMARSIPRTYIKRFSFQCWLAIAGHRRLDHVLAALEVAKWLIIWRGPTNRLADEWHRRTLDLIV